MIIPAPEQPKKRRHGSPEGKIQAECYKHFWDNYPQYRRLYFAVPNENTRSDSSAITGAIRKAMGVTRGVSDTLLLVPSGPYHGLCIEYKTPDGQQSEYQKEWQSLVEAQGYRYEICRSLEQFKEIIKDYFLL